MRNEYLLIKGMLNKFDYAVSAGYAEAELEPDLIKKRIKKRQWNAIYRRKSFARRSSI